MRLSNPPLAAAHRDIERGARMLVDLLPRGMTCADTQAVQFAPKLMIRETA